MKPLFDPVKFGREVQQKLADDGLSFRDAQEACGVDHCSLHRVTTGKPPSVETYLRLVRWLESR